ncbi:MAG: ABC transporter permease subunit [Brevinema sp.]
MFVSRNPKFYITLLLICILLFFLIFPLFSLLSLVFVNNQNEFVGIHNFIAIFQNPNILKALENSFMLSFWSATIAVTLSFFFSYGIFVLPKHFKIVFTSISSLFLLIPSIVIATILMYLFGKLGIFTKLFGFNIDIYGFKGIVIAEIIYIFPILSVYFLLALQNMNLQLHQVAELFGASRFRRFFTITIPSLKTYFFSAFMIAFITAFTDFGIPKILGGNYNVLATEIFKQVIGLHNINLGAVIAFLLIIPSLIFFIINLYFNKTNADKLSKKNIELPTHKLRNLFYIIYCSTISLIILTLLVLMFFGSFAQKWPYEWTLSLRSYQFEIFGHTLLEVINFTVVIAFSSAVFGTILVFLSAYISIREKKFLKLRKAGYFFSLLPNSIPGMVLGIAYIYFFNNRANPLNFIYNTAFILIFANIIHYFAQPYLAFANRFQTLNPDYENVQKIYGGSWISFLFKIIIPLSSAEISYALSYFFINSMLTISALIFLYTPTTRVLSVLMVSKGDEGEFSIIFAIAVIIFFINLIVGYGLKILSSYYFKKTKKEAEIKTKKAHDLQQNGKDTLQLVSEILQKQNLIYWLDYATLLGYIRESDFIKGDININFAVLDIENTKELVDSLHTRGFHHIEVIKQNDLESYLKAKYHHVDIEIYFYRQKENRLESLILEENGNFLCKSFPLIKLIPISFKGTNQFIPENYVEYLYEIYGANFMMPIY